MASFLPGTAESQPTLAASATVRTVWTRYGTGLVTGLAVADVPGGGLVVGGRGVGALGPSSLRDGRYVWANKWEGSPDPPGDSETVLDMRLADVTGDGLPETLAGGGDGLFAMDGRTGHTLWVARGAGPEGDFSRGAWDLDTADFNLDGVADAAFGDLVDDRITGVDGRDGSYLWYYPREGAILDIAAGDLDLDGHPEVVVAGSVDFPSQSEIHTVSGASMAEGRAKALWTQQFPVAPDPPSFGDPRVVAIGQVQAATPEPEVVVAGGGGYLNVFDGPTGAAVGGGRLDGSISDVVLVDLDDDPDLEIVASNDYPTEVPGGTVDAFDASGAHLWTLETPGAAIDLVAADLTGDGAPEVVVAGGWRDTAPQDQAAGFVLALDPRAGPDVMWKRNLPEYAATVVAGTVFGAFTVAAGQGEEGGLIGLDPSGRTRWVFRTGGRVEEADAADLDGDGSPEVVEGADDSAVAVSDSEGRLLWAARVPGREGPDVIQVATGDLVPAAGLEVVAGTWEFDFAGPPGRLHAYASDGEPLWSVDAAGVVSAVAVADLEQDGGDDVVIATSTDGSAARYDGAGGLVWTRAVDTGTEATLALVDASGDQVLDLIVGRKSIAGGTVYALDGRTGSELWRRQMPLGINWLSTTGRPRDGILAGDLGGGVYRLAARTGAQVWSASLGWSSWDGQWSVDANHDGVRDVASVFEDGYARMLDGRTGVQMWAAPGDGQPGLTVTTLRGGIRSQVVMGTYPAAPIAPAAVWVFDATTGRRVGSAPVESLVLDLTPVNLDVDPAQEVVAGAGWQVHSFDVEVP